MRKPIPTHCSKCERPMRNHGKSLEEFPGTVIRGAGDLCSTCYQRQREGKAERKHYEPGSARIEAIRNIADSACVLIRADITPRAYKTLNAAGVDISAMFARYAQEVARQLDETHHLGAVSAVVDDGQVRVTDSERVIGDQEETAVLTVADRRLDRSGDLDVHDSSVAQSIGERNVA